MNKTMKKVLVIIFCVQLFTLNSLSLKPRNKISDKRSNEYNHVFESFENEVKLAKYFMNGTQKRNCQKLSQQAQTEFIIHFWKSFDPNPITEENEFLNEIRIRINYADLYLKNSRDGWKSDMGRVYIRFGEPYEIIKHQIEVAGYYEGLEYEVWKYPVNVDGEEIFIFLELQKMCDKRLVFSNTDSEVSFANYQQYFGNISIENIIGGYYE